MMCDLLGVTRSGYYAWLKEPISNRAHENARLLRLIRRRSPRVTVSTVPLEYSSISRSGETCSKHRVARLMRANNIRAVRGYGAQRYSRTKPSVLIPNILQRKFTVARPNTPWSRIYLYSHLARLALSGCGDGPVLSKDRRVSTKPTIARELVLDAVMMAVRQRRRNGLVIHSIKALNMEATIGGASAERTISSRA